MPTPRPPVGGSKESEREDQFSGHRIRRPAGLPFGDQSWQTSKSFNAAPIWPRPSDSNTSTLASYVALFEIQDVSTVLILALRHQLEDDYH